MRFEKRSRRHPGKLCMHPPHSCETCMQEPGTRTGWLSRPLLSWLPSGIPPQSRPSTDSPLHARDAPASLAHAAMKPASSRCTAHACFPDHQDATQECGWRAFAGSCARAMHAAMADQLREPIRPFSAEASMASNKSSGVDPSGMVASSGASRPSSSSMAKPCTIAQPPVI